MRKIVLDYTEGEFSTQDNDYIHLLERYKSFWELIDTAREYVGIKDGTFLKNYSDPEIYTKADNCADDITRLFNLPSSWLPRIRDFIVMNKFCTPQEGIFLSAENWDTDGRISDFHIIVMQNMSFEAFYKWLMKNRLYIKTRLKSLPKKNRRLRTKTEERMRIFELHERGYKPSKIEAILFKEYPDADISSTDISRIVDDLHKVLNRTYIK